MSCAWSISRPRTGSSRNNACSSGSIPKEPAMRLVLASFVVLVSVLPVGARQQQPTTAGDQPVFRSTASLVSLNVSVTDRENHFVTDLKEDDFAVFEDDVRQPVRFFESSQVPVDL